MELVGFTSKDEVDVFCVEEGSFCDDNDDEGGDDDDDVVINTTEDLELASAPCLGKGVIM